MKKKIGVIVALSIMITGINYPTYSVYAQEENQDIFQSEENSAESDLQQENGEQTLNEDVDIDTESVTEESQEQGVLKENSWRYQDGELIRSAEDEISVISDVYAPNATKKGIDVSEHNRNIDWEKVKAAGIDYAIIRCGYGDNYDNQDDKQWLRNVSECERLGIPYGVYIYSYAQSTDMATSEAQHVLRLISGHKLSYPVYFDMEDNSTLGSDFGAIAQTFCSTVQNAGYTVGVYANLNWWNNYLTDTRFNQWHRWSVIPFAVVMLLVVDVIARAEDASKISRIVERFNLASVDTASIVTEAEKSKDAKDGQSEPDIGVQEKAEKDKLLDELMGKPVQKEENAPNPSVAKTEKSPQSEPISEQPKKSAEGATMTKEKPSVREELRKIKESRKEQKAEIDTSALNKSGASDRAKSANGKTEHKQPQRKKKKPKFKETR